MKRENRFSTWRRIYRRWFPESLRRPIWLVRRAVHRSASSAARWLMINTRWRILSLSRPVAAAWVRRRLGAADHEWLFVLGVNNSGTSLLCKILSMHAEIRGLPNEGQLLTRALLEPSRSGVVRIWSEQLSDFRWTEESHVADALRVKYDWSLAFERGGGKYLLEKSPPNTVRSRWLQDQFTPARFIALVRSPYAVCEGINRRMGYELERAAHHWARANRILLEDMQHLERCLLIPYEMLCSQPEEELRRVAAFLDLRDPFPRAAFEGKLTVHNIEGKPRALESLNARSLARLSAADIALIDRITGDVMRRLGYEQLSESKG